MDKNYFVLNLNSDYKINKKVQVYKYPFNFFATPFILE